MRDGIKSPTLPNANGVIEMDIETLYPLVTEAIRRAEVLEDLHAPGAKDAYRDVSRLEECIAGLLPPADAEGAIARHGAVSAAISGGEFQRAIDLVVCFKADIEPNTSIAADLDTLRGQAMALRAREDGGLQVRYSAAFARYGFGEIQRFISAYRKQGAPLPIQ